MRGIYTTKRKTGTTVCIDYTPPDGPRERPKIEFVPNGPNMVKRLSEAKKRAHKELIRCQAAIAEDRYESVVRKRRAPTFAEYVQESYIPAMRLALHYYLSGTWLAPSLGE